MPFPVTATVCLNCAESRPSRVAWLVLTTSAADLQLLADRNSGVLLSEKLGPTQSVSAQFERGLWLERFAGGCSHPILQFCRKACSAAVSPFRWIAFG